MLFSVLHIGSQVIKDSEYDSIDFLSNLSGLSFSNRAGQALVTGQYQKARPYSVEAVLLYGVCKYMQKEELDTDPDRDAWVIMGVGARLAMRMGYHRDPRHLAKISPFEGEMRRRTFWVMMAFDILLSSQTGLPAILHQEECDTEPPSNLFDSDFDQDCKTIPSSRPATDPTPMLYSCYKGGLTRVFGRVVRHALSPRIPLYQDIMRLDSELRETHASIPRSLVMRSIASQFIDTASTVLHRLYLELLYLKSLCVLHRHYLSNETTNSAFDYSRTTCTDAALQILAYQAELHAALQPGGQFCNDKYMLSSLTLHDFLLGTTITCLGLYESHNSPATISLEVKDLQARRYDALKHSHGIWLSRKAFSRDARRASNVLTVILSKIPKPIILAQPMSVSAETTLDSYLSTNGIGSAANLSGNSSCGLNLPNTSDTGSAGSLDSFFTDADYIDWVRFSLPERGARTCDSLKIRGLSTNFRLVEMSLVICLLIGS